jgi:hypothetical protein
VSTNTCHALHVDQSKSFLGRSILARLPYIIGRNCSKEGILSYGKYFEVNMVQISQDWLNRKVDQSIIKHWLGQKPVPPELHSNFVSEINLRDLYSTYDTACLRTWVPESCVWLKILLIQGTLLIQGPILHCTVQGLDISCSQDLQQQALGCIHCAKNFQFCKFLNRNFTCTIGLSLKKNCLMLSAHKWGSSYTWSIVGTLVYVSKTCI